VSGPSDDAATIHVRQSRRRADTSGISDFKTLVTVPGKPDAVRAFTETESGEAARYAEDTGGNTVSLPVSARPAARADPAVEAD
jgi:hypothetical protein